MNSYSHHQNLYLLVIGNRIRTLRKLYHISQTQLGKGIVGQTMISFIEKGTQYPTLDVLGLLSDRLADKPLTEAIMMLRNGDLNIEKLMTLFNLHHSDLIDIVTQASGGPYYHSIVIDVARGLFIRRDADGLRQISAICLEGFGQPELSEMFFYRGWTRLLKGEFQKARQDFAHVKTNVSLIPDFLKGSFYYALGYVEVQFESYSNAMWCAEQCITCSTQHNDFTMYAKALALSATIHSRVGRAAEAKKLYLVATETLERLQLDNSTLIRTKLSLADVCETLCQFEEAEHWVTEAEVLATSTQDDLALSALSRIQSRLYYRRQDITNAVTSVYSAITYAKASGDAWSLGWSYLLASGLIHNISQRIHYAKQAYEATEFSPHRVLHAMTAEALSLLCASDEKDFYLHKALSAYRTHVAQNTDFTNSADIIFTPPQLNK